MRDFVRIRSVSVAALLTVSLAACASGSDTAAVPEPAGPHLTVVAKDVAYDTHELKMTANQPTTIFFMNRESGVPHNIAIAAAQGAPPSMFDGTIISGGAIVYDVPAFGAGTYFFFCKVHPAMNGTVTVTP